MSFLTQLQNYCCTGRKRKESYTPPPDQYLQDQVSTDEKTNIKNPKKISKTLKLKQRNPWQKLEDNQLMELYDQYPQNWQQISKYMVGRSGKQIRDRYINALDPNINRNEWTHDEDLLILHKYINLGSKWSVIAQYLKGRPENMIKNRFYSSIKKKISKGDFEITFKNQDNYIHEKQTNNEENILDHQSQYDLKIFDFSQNHQQQSDQKQDIQQHYHFTDSDKQQDIQQNYPFTDSDQLFKNQQSQQSSNGIPTLNNFQLQDNQLPNIYQNCKQILQKNQFNSCNYKAQKDDFMEIEQNDYFQHKNMDIEEQQNLNNSDNFIQMIENRQQFQSINTYGIFQQNQIGDKLQIEENHNQQY